jgi:hypothetical protein
VRGTSEVLSAKEGLICEPAESPGALVKICNLNSACDLLDLVKSVEYRRKIKKMQTQLFFV